MLCKLVNMVVVFMRTGPRLQRWEGTTLILRGMARWVLDSQGR